ncbi:MAG: Hsp20/alpha crystallin family protein [Clostridia bacterium]|nr:Hsp20/alpha crystallin family protein [Clostridia bacterium]
MDLVRRGPWEEVARLRRDVNRVLESLRYPWQAEAYTPRTDIYETDREVVVTAEIPGVVARDDLEVGVSEDSITIRGEVKRAQETREENFAQLERYYGHFSRTMPLPAKVIPEKAEASYRNGILEVHLPKAEETRRRTVKLPIQ